MKIRCQINALAQCFVSIREISTRQDARRRTSKRVIESRFANENRVMKP